MRPIHLTACLAFAAAVSIASAQPIPEGSEFQVNIYTTSSQGGGGIAMRPTGEFVAVWDSYGQDGDGWGIVARRFDSTGAPVGGEILVNGSTIDHQSHSRVGMDDSGRFVVAWRSGYSLGIGGDIFARRFDSDGQPLGAEFPVNYETYGNQFDPLVAMDGSGRFIIVWSGDPPEPFQPWDVFAQIYDSTGVPQEGPIVVNEETVNGQRATSIAMSRSGSFVIIFGSDNPLGFATTIWARRFDSDWNPLGREFVVSTPTYYGKYGAVADSDADGNFVVAWSQRYLDGSLYGIAARRFDKAGLPVGVEFQVNTTTYGHQYISDAVMDDDGGFIIAWDSAGVDGDGFGAVARRYDSAGVPEGGEFQVNTYTTGHQFFPLLAGDPSGNVTAVWASIGQDGDLYGVMGQRLLGPAGCVPMPGPVLDLQAEAISGGADLLFTWSNTFQADDYVLLAEPVPSGGFTTILDSGLDGASGITVSSVGGTTYYRLAARNTLCGIGPKH